MVQESNCKVAVVGAGPAGCCSAYFLKNFCDVTLFDSSSFLRTILPTGGGRCNLAYNEYDFKELAKYYPRGEKFLYSVFSKFGTQNTIDLFNHLGIKTYIQDDNRIFPQSDSSKEVRDAFLKELKEVRCIQERCTEILFEDERYRLKTDRKEYSFDVVIIAIGGHSGYDILRNLDLKLVDARPSLTGLLTAEDFSSMSGVSVEACWNRITDNILFTHKGVSGPLIYKISSLKARDNIPYEVEVDFCSQKIDLQNILNKNPHKQINNVLADFVPHKLADFLLSSINIDGTIKAHNINGKMRDNIIDVIHNFKFKVVGTKKDGEVVTSGGIDLKEVNPKTLESKKYKGLYFVGEVLDIDGFCGGFNLQNCWSTAFVASDSIIRMILE